MEFGDIAVNGEPIARISALQSDVDSGFDAYSNSPDHWDVAFSYKREEQEGLGAPYSWRIVNGDTNPYKEYETELNGLPQNTIEDFVKAVNGMCENQANAINAIQTSVSDSAARSVIAVPLYIDAKEPR